MEIALNSLKSDGILDFRLGDTVEEVFSRIRKQKLLSDEEIEDYTQALNFEDTNEVVVVVGESVFEDVSGVFLSLSDKGLNSIIVNIKHLLSVSQEQQLKQLSKLLSLITGQTPINYLYNMYIWNLRSHNIVLSYGTDFDVTDEICLSMSVI